MGPARSASAAPPTAAQLAQTINDYVEQYPAAAVLEDGRVLFDLRTARHSIEESHGRCLLQLWSEERNLMRTVVDVQCRPHNLRVLTRRMGAPKPTALDFVPGAERRTPSSRDHARRTYLRQLERVLTRQFPGAKVEGMRSAADLEHSFGPAYARGRLVEGSTAQAVIGISAAESPTAIDGILTLALLWLDYCREHGDVRRHFAGLKIIVPQGASRTTAERMAWLNPALARFELYELDERSDELHAIDIRDTGNFHSRLVQAFSPQAAVDACAPGIERVFALLPEDTRSRIELMARSATQVALLLYGLEFARVQLAPASDTFGRDVEVLVGAKSGEILLTSDTEELCRDMFSQLFQSRHPDESFTNPLFRLQPERWLESQLRARISDIVPGACAEMIYAQVPALSSSDRGMLDLLTADREGRLVVIELKANEDLHLPLQALDYWIRVRALLNDRQRDTSGRERSAFERRGYFPAVQLSSRPPRLLLAAPVLRIHPASEPVLRYFSPEIEWELLGLGEDWRHEVTVAFRKHPAAAVLPN